MMTSRVTSVTKDGPMDDEIQTPVEPSAVSAAERAVEAAQRIVVERLELIRLELQDALAQLVQRTGLVLAVGFIAILGWCGLAIALVLVLAEQMPLAASIALVGGVHVLGGGVLGVAMAPSGERRTP
jgi:uncharacterized membrane protein YqjE